MQQRLLQLKWDPISLVVRRSQQEIKSTTSLACKRARQGASENLLEPPTTPINFKASRQKSSNKYNGKGKFGDFSKEDSMHLQVFKKRALVKSITLTAIYRKMLKGVTEALHRFVTPRPDQKQQYCICKQQYDTYGP